MRTLDTILAETPLFHDLEPRILKLMAGCASNVKFDVDEYLCRQDAEANRFFLVRHGKVALDIYVPQVGSRTIDTAREGDVLGWSWLVPPYRWHVGARALERTRALEFDGACLRGKCETDPELGYQLYRRFAQVMYETLQATHLQLLDMYGEPRRN